MSIVVVGFLAYDTVETPNGRVDEVLGSDFKAEDMRLFTERNIDTRGIVKADGLTTRWHGRYHEDLNMRDTVSLSLNVLEGFTPDLLPDQRRADYLYLAPNDPALQEHVLDQVPCPKVVVADIFDHWIESTRPGLVKVLERIQVLLCSDNEARTLTGEHNLVKAGRAILKMGPAPVLIKRGEYGVLQFSKEGMFAVPAYPLEEVVDPTGAGDTFAGAMMGFLARHGRITESSLRTAVVYGSVVASYGVERFSLERLLDLSWEEIDHRYREFINLIDSHHSRWTTQ